ncbi:hypothetical protein EW026_g2949 [Hermanssonia centrifuga]|uniref:Uncharacterized protein n=1 Tax=Hermanssonia centrifuga TaxID=98765 RepID=A0A4S4KLN9_9APHY|nr:hypothetical protein EW026_g2949 [Hermanssonia centrifuga]
MFTPSFILIALCSQLASAAPYVSKTLHSSDTSSWTSLTNSTTVNDTQIAQFALSLEYLESAFYSQGLSQFNDSDFQNSGFDPSVRERFVQIAEHEATHVVLLKSVLGSDAPQPCNYTFPFTDPASFASISFALESAGESAYLGAVSLIQNKTILTTAGSILTVEARQASYVGSSVLNNTPFNGPFDTPLNASAVWSLASQFIVACPSTNPPLIVTPLPVLTLSPANATVNQSVAVALSNNQDFSPSNIPIVNSTFVAPTTNGSTPLFLAFYHGLQVTFAPLDGSNSTTVPDGLAGVVYAALVSSNNTAPTPETTLSGLSVLNIPVPATANSTSN